MVVGFVLVYLGVVFPGQVILWISWLVILIGLGLNFYRSWVGE